jgi:phosphoribosylaminoimidazole-succinocarboxamide synthase
MLPGLSLWRRGKVRDVYEHGEQLLIVASDRLSAFDVVLPTPVPDKGAVLTQLSLFWFEHLRDVVPNHIVSGEVDDFPPSLRAHRDALRRRSMLVLRTEPFPVECVVRGYLAGSAYKDYRREGAVCGIRLSPGLREGERLPQPLFTPATKAASGHDQNISFEVFRGLTGAHAEHLRELSLELYRRAARHAEERGLLLADTKLEFGLRDGRIVWIDEALTPDSSRFWSRADWRPGASLPGFDKQHVRDWLEAQAWDKRPPGPALPDDVVLGLRRRYYEALQRLAAGTPYAGRVSPPDEVQR